MSHFTQLKTQLRDFTYLTKTLSDLNLAYETGNVMVRGYQGQSRSAQIVLRQGNQHDIGFAWNGQSYELVADLHYWQQPWTVDNFLKKIQQRYAYNTVVTECEHQGFQLTTQEAGQDGTVRLVMQRWSS